MSLNTVATQNKPDSARLVAFAQEMEQEQLDEQLMAPAAVPSTRVAQPAAAEKLPSAPTGRAPAARTKAKTQEEIEYDELEALQAEMAL